MSLRRWTGGYDLLVVQPASRLCRASADWLTTPAACRTGCHCLIKGVGQTGPYGRVEKLGWGAKEGIKLHPLPVYKWWKRCSQFGFGGHAGGEGEWDFQKGWNPDRKEEVGVGGGGGGRFTSIKFF